jgi:hypothetical protein
MRFFVLLTAALVIGLAAFASVLPGTDAYVRGVDDGPPEVYKTIAEAKDAAGFDFPEAGERPGWQIETISVVPVYFFRRLLEDHPERAVTRITAIEGRRAFVWGGVTEPPPGVHDYVSMAYTSCNGIIIALNVNYPPTSREPVAPTSEMTTKTRQSVLIGNTPATLTTLESKDVEVMAVMWRVNGVRLSATSYSFTPNETSRLTPDEFLAFLANVR